MENLDPLLSELCSICHLNPPKYRCPRCFIRTCSLPCTRRHKLWSECSGVRDPAAFVRRNDLATESAFDRDFNFITGIERSLERAGRDAENRGIDIERARNIEPDEISEVPETRVLGAGSKRKRPGQGLMKGEASFSRALEAGAVRVFKAPNGMTRNIQNKSRWNSKQKCIIWTVEWITTDGQKSIGSCWEKLSIADNYDRVPLPQPPKKTLPNSEQTTDKSEESESASTESVSIQNPTTTTIEAPADDVKETTEADTKENKPLELPITPHRGLYFYLHRPRTTTKEPVLIPLPPSATIGSALRERTVLEFPTIYALDPTETDMSQFLLEEDYLRTIGPEAEDKFTDPDDDNGHETLDISGSAVNLQNVDENKILEVLKQDLLKPAV
ncbi:Zinc finger HIT-type [Penicillium taxi]|uniref:Zinc finger HIT-type n=1 Tax=Penicillium taxi TaxID=168475 RepID=UPI002545A0C1|nr:Zinc finger HIT-type [Penicillium taxi]KAJ5893677.1 Zinc finger HIT-type [Penicillium taxi]